METVDHVKRNVMKSKQQRRRQEKETALSPSFDDGDATYHDDAVANVDENFRCHSSVTRSEDALTPDESKGERNEKHEGMALIPSVTNFYEDVESGPYPQVKTREVDLTKRRQHCAIGWTAALFVVVATIAAVAVYKVMSNRDAKASGSGGVDDTISNGGIPPSNPLSPVFLCEAHYVAASLDVRRACEAACQAASCCTSRGPSSCATIKIGGICDSCAVLVSTEQQQGDHIREAPSNLNLLCSPESISTESGRIICDDVCYAGRCCHSVCGDHPNCPGYRYCWGGVSYPYPDQIVNSVVEELCTRELIFTRDGRIACEEVCKDRSCCYARGDSNCYHENQLWCIEYAPCVFLQEVEPAEDQDDDYFSVDIEIEYPTAPQDDDYHAEIQELDEELDLNTGANPNTAQFAIAQACAPDNVQLPEGRNGCEKLCESRLCCYEESHQASICDMAWCRDYKPCEILVLYDSASIAEPDTYDSNEFEGITSLSKEEGEDDDYNGNGNGNEEDLFHHVATLCSHENIMTEKGKNTCKQACLSGLRCCSAWAGMNVSSEGDCNALPEEMSSFCSKNLNLCSIETPVINGTELSPEMYGTELPPEIHETELSPEIHETELSPEIHGTQFLDPSENQVVETEITATITDNSAVVNDTNEYLGDENGDSASIDNVSGGEQDVVSTRLPEFQNITQNVKLPVVSTESPTGNSVGTFASPLRETCSKEVLVSIDEWVRCTRLCEERECCAGEPLCHEHNIGFCEDFELCGELIRSVEDEKELGY